MSPFDEDDGDGEGKKSKGDNSEEESEDGIGMLASMAGDEEGEVTKTVEEEKQILQEMSDEYKSKLNKLEDEMIELNDKYKDIEKYDKEIKENDENKNLIK